MGRSVVVVVILLSAFAGNAGRLIFRDYEDTMQRRHALVRDLATLAAGHVQRVLTTASVAIDQVAAQVRDTPTPDAVHTIDHWKHLREHTAHLEGGESLWVVDANGKTILESASYPGRQAPIRDLLPLLTSDAPLSVGSAVVERGEDSHVVYPLVRPLRDESGRTVAAVLAVMNAAHLTRFHGLSIADDLPVIAIHRKTGEVVARRPNPPDMVGRSLADSPLFPPHLKESPEGVFVVSSPFDGVTRITAVRRVGEQGLVVMVGLDPEPALADWRARSLRTLVESLVGALAVLLAMAWAFRHHRQERWADQSHPDDAPRHTHAEDRDTTHPPQALPSARRDTTETRHDEDPTRPSAVATLAMVPEFLTPLNRIIRFCDLMARESEGPLGSPLYQRYAASARDFSQHLLDLINEAMDHTQAGGGTPHLEEGIVDLDATVGFAVRLLESPAEQAGVTLSVSVTEDARFLRADERRMRQILLILINHVMQHTPSGGIVTVSARLEKDGLILRVADTTPDAIPDTISDRGKDSGIDGLNLPLTKHLVELHGGDVSWSNEPGRDCAVRVRLPGLRALSPVSTALPPASDGVPRGLTILLVEDDPTIRRGVATLLHDWNHRVIEAANADEALLALQSPDALDLLFSDVVMPPGMTGTELAELARRLRPDLPILLASGSFPYVAGMDITRNPGVAVIAKPYDIGALKAQIARLCGVPPPENGTPQTDTTD